MRSKRTPISRQDCASNLKKMRKVDGVAETFESRIVEQLEQKDGMARFAQQYQLETDIELRDMLEESASESQEGIELFTLYLQELRKFEATFILNNRKKMNRSVMAEMIGFEAAQEAVYGDQQHPNLKMMHVLGASTEI